MHVVTTSRGLDEVTGFDLKAKAHLPFADVEAQELKRGSSSISEESFRVVIVGDESYGDDILMEPKLKPEAEALIKSGEMSKFARLYGTHYVVREHRVARVVVSISVDRWSETTLKNVSHSGMAKAGFFGIGAELKMSIQNDLKSAAKRGAVKVEVATLGGAGLKGFGELAEALIANGQDFYADVAKALKDLFKGFNRHNSDIGSVTVASYEGFGWKPEGILWNRLFEDKLQKCADLYHAGRKVQKDIQRIANATPADKPLKKKLDAYARHYGDYLTDLAKFQEALLNKDATFVEENFPCEPQIDQETARALIERFSTLEARIVAQMPLIQSDYVEANSNDTPGFELHKEDKPARHHVVHVKFPSRFGNSPKVAVSFANINAGGAGGNRGCRIDATVTEVTNEGFNLKVASWDATLVYGYRVTWIAYGPPDTK
jgi:hypothetical protein